MILQLLFWVFAAIDAIALGLVAVLGLAAIVPSKSSALAAPLLFVPLLLLVGAVYLHERSPSALLRAVAFVVVVLPALGLGVARLYFEAVARANPDAIWGETKLVRVLRELPTDPSRVAELAELLRAGADPNETGDDVPLVMAIYAARQVGDQPLRLLLDAGADPNRVSAMMTPAWFAATGVTVPLPILQLLLERGADLHAVGNDGRGAVWKAVDAENWPAAKLLLQRGARVGGISPMGLSLVAALEGHVRTHGDAGGVGEVLAAVRLAEGRK